MAKAAEDHWNGALTGLVVTRRGYEATCRNIEIVRASHPVPDAAGRDAAQRMLDMAKKLGPDDLALCLISGGGSTLPLPLPGLTLAEKQEINRQLLKSGAPIGDMNCVRRHLSSIKGGRLAAAAHPAKVVTLLLISDVPGDDPADIASGPVPDVSTCGRWLFSPNIISLFPPSRERRWKQAPPSP